MRILFFTHYFPPEVNAPATRTYEHCVRWARAGHDVTVVTCVPNCPNGVLFDGYRNRLRPQIEMVDGLRVIRIWTYIAANAGTVKRIVNYLSYMLSAILVSLRLPRPDVVVATSPQFFCGWAGVIASRIKQVPLVLEIRDIWPESIRAVGAIKNKRLLKLLEWLERRLYRAADEIVTVGEGYRDEIARKVDPATCISIVSNGVDLQVFSPQPADERFLHAWDLEEKFVCTYVGTIGMAHGLEVVVEAARILAAKGRRDIAFCLVGDGAERERLESQVQQAGLQQMIVFTGRQPKTAIPGILASSSACLIHLRRCQLFETVIPSKIFEAMAMTCPIILGVNGHARRLVETADAGLAFEPECAKSLLEAVETLADDRILCAKVGTAAREFVERQFNRDVLAGRYLALLCGVVGVGDTADSDAPVCGDDVPTPLETEPASLETSGAESQSAR